MSSGDSYQCSSMDDDDDELEGFSPTSPWKRNRNRKDYSDDDDIEEDEEEYKAIVDFTPLATAPPSPVAVANVRVNHSLGNKRKTSRIQTGGKVPRLLLASKNIASTLIDRNPDAPLKGIIPVSGITRSPTRRYQAPSGSLARRRLRRTLWRNWEKLQKNLRKPTTS